MKNVYFIGMFLCVLLTIICAGKTIDTSKSNKILTDSITTLNRDKEHLRKYFFISLRLDSVCNQYRSSKRLKEKLKITVKD